MVVEIDLSKDVIIRKTDNEKSIQADKTSPYTRIYFRDENDISGLTYTKEGKNLVITNQSQVITLVDYFLNDKDYSTNSNMKTIINNNGTVTLKVEDGIYSSASDEIFTPNKKGVVTGTIYSDTIDMKNTLSAPLNKKNKGLTINANNGNDIITGTHYNDTITGGLGVNTYNYDFGEASGADTIKLTKEETLILNITYNGSPMSIEDLSFAKYKNNLIIYSTDNPTVTNNEIILKDYFDDIADVSVGQKNIADFLSTEEAALFIDGKGKIKGTKYNDNIIDSNKNDTITAGLGDDTLNTTRGKDTIVETGVYGHDVIENYGSSKITVKLDSFNSDNISFINDDLIYTTDENSSFTYSGFKSEEQTPNLWIKDKKKSYHIVAKTDNTDFSKDKNNNVIFLSGESYTGSKNKKSENIIYSKGVNNYVFQGNTETYIDNDSTDDNYTAALTKSGKLVIRDNDGNDSLTLKNSKSDLILFYNIDNDGNTDDDLVIYNKKAVTYKSLASAYANDSYKGGVKISNYFSNGETEVIGYEYKNDKAEMDISGWKHYVDIFVRDWLNDNNKVSVEDVLLNGSKKEKLALTNIFKTLTYDYYQNDKNSMSKYSDITLVQNNGSIGIYGKDQNGQDKLLYITSAEYIENQPSKSVILLAVDDNGNLMTLSVNSQAEVVSYTLGNNNVISLQTNQSHFDIKLVPENSTLKIYGKDDELLYTLNGFIQGNSQKINLGVRDDNNIMMTMEITQALEVNYVAGNGNFISLDCSEKYSDIDFRQADSTLQIYGKDNTLVYNVYNFITEDKNDVTVLNVLDDNGNQMSVKVDSNFDTVVNLGNNNQITIGEDYKFDKIITTQNGVSDTLVFTDKSYSDFYTKSSALIAYNSGDPLIKKDGSDLTIGDITVQNTDGLNSEIMIKDKNNETKTIILGTETINGTFESEIIMGSNSADNITTNGGNDLVYMGDGSDTLNVTALAKDKSTGKNTAQMTGIGGTTTISDDLTHPALSVYDSSGNDVYNTSFDFGLYIEDYAGNDTVNIKSTNANLMYFFDVVNPNMVNNHSNLYTDLMICDKDAFTSAVTPIATQVALAKLLGQPITIDVKSTLESLQGSFGYVWIDDHYGNTQNIESVNLVGNNNEVIKEFNFDYNDTNSDVYAVAENVANWLSQNGTKYSTAWDVLEGNSKSDMANLLMLYMG